MLFVAIFLRYIIVSGVFIFVFSFLLKDQYLSRMVSNKLRPEGQIQKEIKWSAITSFIFALSGVGLVWIWQNDFTAIYTEPGKFGYLYLPFSLLLSLFIHETYYYWLHRWMHQPKIYKFIHRTHHDSIVTSPWTAFSFHPLESILQAMIIPVILIIIPMHFSMIILLLIIMTISATINHLEIEIYPQNFEKHWLGKWIIGATHHSQHHKKFLVNYGLYFTFWDKWMYTENPDYEASFQHYTTLKKNNSKEGL